MDAALPSHCLKLRIYHSLAPISKQSYAHLRGYQVVGLLIRICSVEGVKDPSDGSDPKRHIRLADSSIARDLEHGHRPT
ncbi:unnamed protein product [Parascedosporium putredinis]|uniref:Uncharacterized protein n=1 Tax=Parascedosporium putredinis TaxID=1442378 RepID=A0A9P1HA53_9PEZI|nr:unnamed protein product [Parascedosporium putredinis]CAI8001044.1 unnamed protein product [Parascedosporium putredinis]